ncbi:IPT/TIG domain-containing protein [uncultured Shewanella sp.]|uniref:IPT/TIG domain-containing protein n=1 Tax=uncultured Shewanella sp. TaxID=173975 RepID=UPI0037044C91
MSYSDPLGLNLTDRAFSGSKVFIQGQNIPRQNSYLIINNGNITYNIKISDFDDDGFFMYLPEDIDDEKEYEYFIANGDYKSNSKYFRVSSSLTPIVTELQSARYNIGDIITLKGRGFHQNMSVHFGTVIISPDSVINNEAIITIPENATSGFIHVESLQLHSNDIFIDIN